MICAAGFFLQVSLPIWPGFFSARLSFNVNPLQWHLHFAGLLFSIMGLLLLLLLSQWCCYGRIFFYLSTPSFVIQFCVWFCEICFEFESVERFYCILCVVAFVIQFLSTRTASLSHSFSFLSWVALDVHSSPHTYTLFSRLSFYSLMYL